ncbi:bifunctional 5,10-methylenetetrahydrofolate dehydrogenase/5,10-methenyltetrahydrofolate cyclohydrolase [Candidatus Avelusimicrobium facis]|uniref:bifunctional 5,10-methylenetetrahydrofolate dehydrogenase/5,10-methenyltetrahydrofolate cyclohydrolase n=1 Tax=Candidatus Avelusimicrobium facis TaxID=3416203 RepID=UPI0015B639EB
MILEGKTLAAALRAPLAGRAAVAREKLGRPISLFAIGSSEDYGAYVYLKKEVQAAQTLGVCAQLHCVDSHTRAEDFIARIQQASADKSIDAILVARPLPDALAGSGFERFIAPEKDIDGMSPVSVGNLFSCKTWAEVQALPTFVPCTALAVIRLLDAHGIDPQGMEAAVIGRSSTVGRPLAHLLSCRNATVKVCHTFTRDLARALQKEELICSAAGQAGLLNTSNVPAGSTVIDIATNLDTQDRLCGDADTQALLQAGCRISPVPGGVGPVTLACLLENIILSGERKI